MESLKASVHLEIGITDEGKTIIIADDAGLKLFLVDRFKILMKLAIDSGALDGCICQTCMTPLKLSSFKD